MPWMMHVHQDSILFTTYCDVMFGIFDYCVRLISDVEINWTYVLISTTVFI
jgi:hypothetical protein